MIISQIFENFLNIWQSLPKLRRWSFAVAYTLMDQTLMSGTNFLLNIMLARWLTPEQYGLFGVTYAILLAILGIHNAIIIEPMAIIGPHHYRDQLSSYINAAFLFNASFSVFTLMLINVIIFVGIFPSDLNLTILAFSVATVSVCMLWFLRRTCYLIAKSNVALHGNVVYSLVLAGGLWILYRQQWLHLSVVYGLIAVSSVAASLAYTKSLRLGLLSVIQSSDIQQRDIFKAHWQYGSWIFAASIAHSLSTSFYLPVVGATVGLAESAFIKAMQNLIMPLRQVLTGLSMFAMPLLSRKRTSDSSYPVKKLGRILVVALLVTVPYALIIYVFGEQLLHMLYENSFYTSYSSLLRVFALFMVVLTTVQVYSIILRVMENPHAIFASKLGSAIFSLTFGIGLVWNWGIGGAVWGMLLGVCIENTILILYLNKQFPVMVTAGKRT